MVAVKTGAHYVRRHREEVRQRQSGVRPPTRVTPPDGQLLDNAVSKAGTDFPALGALVRLAWTSAA